MGRGVTAKGSIFRESHRAANGHYNGGLQVTYAMVSSYGQRKRTRPRTHTEQSKILGIAVVTTTKSEGKVSHVYLA